MQYSTNYNLNLVEGTDIVNPLVIDKPNYITIDTQMKANEDASITTASEVKTGTIHAISRTNGDSNVFRFTATSVFNAGDTCTVDGVGVSTVLPSGESLGDNAWVVNSTVLASLVGTLLTIYTVGGTAANTTTFNGQLPSYYLNSTNEFYNNSGSGMSASNVQDAVDELHAEITGLVKIGTLIGTTNSNGILTAPAAQKDRIALGAWTSSDSPYFFGTFVAIPRYAEEGLKGFYLAGYPGQAIVAEQNVKLLYAYIDHTF